MIFEPRLTSAFKVKSITSRTKAKMPSVTAWTLVSVAERLRGGRFAAGPNSKKIGGTVGARRSTAIRWTKAVYAPLPALTDGAGFYWS